MRFSLCVLLCLWFWRLHLLVVGVAGILVVCLYNLWVWCFVVCVINAACVLLFYVVFLFCVSF